MATEIATMNIRQQFISQERIFDGQENVFEIFDREYLFIFDVQENVFEIFDWNINLFLTDKKLYLKSLTGNIYHRRHKTGLRLPDDSV